MAQHSDHEGNAFKKLCRTAFACEADAQQALTRFAVACRPRFFLRALPSAPTPHYGEARASVLALEPSPIRSSTISRGPLASRLPDRQARVDRQ